jgi:glutamine cyclotransferase
MNLAQKKILPKWFIFWMIFSACNPLIASLKDPNAAPVYGYEIVNTYPHDTRAFSQGLAYADGFIYEGTGLYGQSSLRRVELQTGRVLQQVHLANHLFGEGIAVWGDLIYQLTWTHGVGYVYDKTTLKQLRTFSYSGQGWGLTHDGRHLILSDGSAVLRFIDPSDFSVIRRVTVTDYRGRRIDNLNELEYVEGEIFANIWNSDFIARIAPNGQITGWIDLSGIMGRRKPSNPEAVLNGIAYDPVQKRLFVTGKLWPTLFEIRLIPPS